VGRSEQGPRSSFAVTERREMLYTGVGRRESVSGADVQMMEWEGERCREDWNYAHLSIQLTEIVWGVGCGYVRTTLITNIQETNRRVKVVRQRSFDVDLQKASTSSPLCLTPSIAAAMLAR